MPKSYQQTQKVRVPRWKNILSFTFIASALLILLTYLQYLNGVTIFIGIFSAVSLIISFLQLASILPQNALENFFTRQILVNPPGHKKSNLFIMGITKWSAPVMLLVVLLYVLSTILSPHTKVITRTRFIPHTTIVTSTTNSGPGSLRQIYAEAFKGDTIQFSPKLKGQTIVLTTDFILNKDIKFLGPGMESATDTTTLSSPEADFKNDITISNSNNAQIYSLPNTNISLVNINFTNAVTKNGSFINNAGVADFSHDTLDNNQAEDNGNGGAISNTGSLTIRDSYLSGNITANSGGSIYNLGGLLILYHTTLYNNTAELEGGGIYNEEGVVNVVNYSLINGNQVKAGDGGGIESRSSLLVISNNSDIQDNTTTGDGGGIMIAGGQAQLESTLVNHNTAGQRGGGMAVEINTDDGYTGQVTIHNQEFQTNWLGDRDSSSPSANIWGIATELGNNSRLFSGKDTGKQGGRYQPTQNPQFLGAINFNQFNDFCKNYNNVNAYSGVSMATRAFDIACITNTGEKKLLTDLMPSDTFPRVCSTIFKDKLQQDHVLTTNVIARLGNNDNPLSWQCFEKENRLGNITTDLVSANNTRLDDYCQSQGYEKAIKIADNPQNAYDWKCHTANKDDGIYMSEACVHEYGPNAVDIITSFTIPDSWECWGP